MRRYELSLSEGEMMVLRKILRTCTTKGIEKQVRSYKTLKAKAEAAEIKPALKLTATDSGVQG